MVVTRKELEINKRIHAFRECIDVTVLENIVYGLNWNETTAWFGSKKLRNFSVWFVRADVFKVSTHLRIAIFVKLFIEYLRLLFHAL